MRIAAYTPALNEARHALRWAEATADADYRLVADTGSTDDTVELLRGAGVTVVPISVVPWRFDIARNTALSLLPSDVELCASIDMDEVAAPGFFAAARAAWDDCGPFGRGRVLIDTGTWWRTPRLHARHGYRWVHPCHELLVPYGADKPPPDVDVDARILHQPDDTKSRGQYLGLLQMAAAESPHDARCWVYLARERHYRGDRPGVLAAVERALALPGWDVERAALCRWAAAAAADADAAVRWLLRGTVETPVDPEAWRALAEHHHAVGRWAPCAAAAEHGSACPPADHYLADPATPARLADLAARCAAQLAPRVVPTATVVVPVWNRWDMTARCLTSLGRHPDVVVVDNGSSDATAYELTSCAGTVLRNDNNLGYAAACNQGAAAASGDVLVFLNNDTVVPSGWLTDLLAPFSDPRVGAVGPMTNCASGQQGVTLPGYDVERLADFAAAWRAAHAGELVACARLVGFCLAVRRAAFDDVGGFDPSFGLGGYEDDDLCRRLSDAGWLLVTARSAFVHHDGHATFDGNGLDWHALQSEAAKVYAGKHG